LPSSKRRDPLNLKSVNNRSVRTHLAASIGTARVEGKREGTGHEIRLSTASAEEDFEKSYGDL